MVRLRETMNPEERQGLTPGPTKRITATNQYGAHCADCGDLYYVDEAIMRKVRAAREGDPSEVPFRCTDCEDEYAEEESGRQSSHHSARAGIPGLSPRKEQVDEG